MSTSTLNSRCLNYVRSRVRCPQSADDVCQQILISAWQAGIDASASTAYLWSIVRSRLVDHVRSAARLPVSAPVEALDAEPSRETETPDVSTLLDSAGPYREDVASWMAGEAESSVRGWQRVSRGLKRIRSELGVD